MMPVSRYISLGARVLAGLSLAVTAATVPTRAASPHAATPPLVVWQGSLPFTRNFNPFTPQPLDFTKSGVYEPLYIVSYAGNKTIPWLATSYKWSKDLKTLTFTIRQGVKWSDGVPFTAKDVYYTLTAGQKVSAMDQVGLWGPKGLATGVTTAGNTVSIHFKLANVSTFAAIVDNLYIVPEHIWSKVKNPTTWTNSTPVGTGPFTQVQDVNAQSYDLGRNPYYWHPLHVNAVRVVSYTGNDPGNLDLESGKIDWAGSFIPYAEKIYDPKNPNFHHYYSTRNTPVPLYLNDSKYPFSLPDFRKAVSMAINRVAIWRNAEYGYQPPATATGLNGQYASWMDPSIPNTLGTYNPAAAKALLAKAGFKMRGGKLFDPKGHPVAFNLYVVTGWTDWIAACQIIAQNLRALGMDVYVKPLQYSDYFTHISMGTFDAAMSWSCGGATPYNLYSNWTSAETYKPVGTAAGACNFERWTNPEMNRLFVRYRGTLDTGQQHALVNQMQRMFVTYMPVIPTTINAIWYEYNTTHYTGFPTKDNYYVAGPPWELPDRLVVLTTIYPTGH